MRAGFLTLLLTLFAFSCISLSVYIPYQNSLPQKDIYKMEILENGFLFTPKEQDSNLPKEIAISGNTKYEAFAYHSPCLFFLESRNLQNIYGNILLVIGRGIAEHPDFYFPQNHSIKRIEINVSHFSLESNDSCFSNNVKISMNSSISMHKTNGTVTTSQYSYQDAIKSYITDFYLLSVIGTIPAIMHSGFRGNRQDQLNQISKNMLLDFTAKLKQEIVTSPEKKL